MLYQKLKASEITQGVTIEYQAPDGALKRAVIKDVWPTVPGGLSFILDNADSIIVTCNQLFNTWTNEVQ